jgi:nucleoside-diphosphate-sugar epimerase
LKKLLVLGSEGFIGHHVVMFALQHGCTVTGVDLIDKKPAGYQYEKLSLLSADLDSFLHENRFDLIVNCAGSGNVGFSIQHPVTDFDFNTRSVIFVLEAIRRHMPEARYIHLSSAAVYGSPMFLPVAETSAIQPISPYGFHKWMAEIICKEYSVLHGMSISVVRPFSVYGPGLQKQLLWDVYQKAKLNNEVELWGTGDETRDFIFVEDVAKAIMVIAEADQEAYNQFNLASGVSVTIKTAVEELFRALSWERNLSFNQQVREGDPRFWQADVSKLNAVGFKPSFSLQQGLNFTATWLHTLNDEQ